MGAFNRLASLEPYDKEKIDIIPVLTQMNGRSINATKDGLYSYFKGILDHLQDYYRKTSYSNEMESLNDSVLHSLHLNTTTVDPSLKQIRDEIKSYKDGFANKTVDSVIIDLENKSNEIKNQLDYAVSLIVIGDFCNDYARVREGLRLYYQAEIEYYKSDIDDRILHEAQGLLEEKIGKLFSNMQSAASINKKVSYYGNAAEYFANAYDYKHADLAEAEMLSEQAYLVTWDNYYSAAIKKINNNKILLQLTDWNKDNDKDKNYLSETNYLNNYSIGATLASERLFRSALYYNYEALFAATHGKNPYYITAALEYIARTNAIIGDSATALKYIDLQKTFSRKALGLFNYCQAIFSEVNTISLLGDNYRALQLARNLIIDTSIMYRLSSLDRTWVLNRVNYFIKTLTDNKDSLHLIASVNHANSIINEDQDLMAIKEQENTSMLDFLSVIKEQQVNTQRQLVIERDKNIKDQKAITVWIAITLVVVLICIWLTILNKSIKRKKDKERLGNLTRMKIHDFKSIIQSIDYQLQSNNFNFATILTSRYHTYFGKSKDNWTNPNLSLADEIGVLKSLISVFQVTNEIVFTENYQEIEVENTRFVPSLFDNLLRNTIIHGFNKRKDVCYFELSVKRERKTLICTIKDNGTPPNEGYTLRPDSGLQILRERICLEWRKSLAKAAIKIEKIPDMKGTLIQFKLPYHVIKS